jgi:SAM-dependent methyltransferase
MSTYEQRLQQEVAHYEKVFKGRMTQDVPPIWDQVEAHLADEIEAATGVRNLYQYVARHVRGRGTVDMLGLGSGACGNELDGIAPLLRQDGCELTLACVDVNKKGLEQAGAAAGQRGIRFRSIVEDINRMSLGENQYDVIVAYASLHHFLELEHVAREINRALRPDGVFVTVDIPTRNGYLMWDETLAAVNAIWRVLPPKYKIDHTGFAVPTFVATYTNIDYSVNCFECINSEAILPALRRHLREIAFVPALSIARRFFDTKFGPNYDLREPLDLAIFNFVMQLDRYYLAAAILQPETFFGAYQKRAAGS